MQMFSSVFICAYLCYLCYLCHNNLSIGTVLGTIIYPALFGF